MSDTNDGVRHSWCLMLVRLNDEARTNPQAAAKTIQMIRDEYMSHFKEPRDSTPGAFCEGALVGEYDFYALFKYNSEGPVWLATRLQQAGVFSKVLSMQATPLTRFRELFGR